jgi:hypothetical protein
MPIDERELRMRRVKRAVKAGASIALALAAGAFLACQRTVVRNDGPSPMGPDARSGPPPSPKDAAVDADVVADVADVEVDAADAEVDADGMIVVRDAAGDIVVRRPPRRPRHHVDRDEHRRGLPVIDNLLE